MATMAKSSGSGTAWLALAGGVALMILAARFAVPIYPGSTRLISLVAVLLGVITGWREAFIIACLYGIAEVFHIPDAIWGNGHVVLENAWQARMTGFLIGLPLAAATAGKIAPQAKGHYAQVFLAMLAGHAVYLLAGMLWLARFITWHQAFADSFVVQAVPALAKSAGAFVLALILRRII